MGRLARAENLVLALVFATDALLYFGALSAASLSRIDTLYQISFAGLQRDRLICLAIFAAAALIAGAYKPARVTDRFDTVYYMLFALAGAGVAQFTLTALAGAEIRAISRRELVLGLALAAIIIPTWRAWAAGWLPRFQALHRNILVLGSEEEGRRIAAEIDRRGNSLAGALYLSEHEFRARVLDRPGDALPADDAVITLSAADHDRLNTLLELCETHCRRTFLHPSLYDTLLLSHARLAEVAGIPLLEVGGQQNSPYQYVKRALDVVLAAAAIVLALPIGIATAIAIKLNSPGPVFYTQERMGRNGVTFRLVKFRSMVADAEAATGPVWAGEDDGRVTAVGRFIRKRRIDELPQLWNVLRGDMSLVGPRPERPFFHEEFRKRWPLFDYRLVVRPGVTSLSHVLGFYGSEPGDRLRYDLIYISSFSFMTDLRILIDTVRVVLGAKGAR